MRISDWSSDVCSSDLCMSWAPMLENMVHSPYPAGGWQSVGKCIRLEASNFICAGGKAAARLSQRRRNAALGPRWWKRDRKSVVSGKSVSVRVDLGGRRIIKKKNKNTHNKRHRQ